MSLTALSKRTGLHCRLLVVTKVKKRTTKLYTFNFIKNDSKGVLLGVLLNKMLKSHFENALIILNKNEYKIDSLLFCYNFTSYFTNR